MPVHSTDTKMTREHGLAVMLVVAFIFIVFSNQARSGSAEAAQTAMDSVATLAPILEALEDSAATQDALVANLRDSLTVERQDRAVERAGYVASIEVEQAEHETLIDSVIARVDSVTAEILVRAQVADSMVHANYERVILSQAEDITGLEVELGAVTRQAALNREGWDITNESRMQAMEGARLWESSYHTERRRGTITKVVGVLVVVATVVLR